MAMWILKTEPSTYSFADLLKDKKTRWDGVKNPVALKNIRSMEEGDRVLIYHTGEERSLIGLAKVASAPYPDPKSPALYAIDIEALRLLKQPVTLAQIKNEPRLSESALVRQGRLSVVPVPESMQSVLLRMAAEL